MKRKTLIPILVLAAFFSLQAQVNTVEKDMNKFLDEVSAEDNTTPETQASTTYAQEGKGEKYEKFQQQKQEKYRNYRDSVNRRYADYLEQKWEKYSLRKPEPAIKNPIEEAPVYDPKKEKAAPLSNEIPIIQPPQTTIPTPVTVHIDPPQTAIKGKFFGTDIVLSDIQVNIPRLSGVDEKSVAKYWRNLNKISYTAIINDIKRIKSELRLNDWGVYQLSCNIYNTYIGNNSNEETVFSVFILSQMGYNAKIGRNGSKLYPLIAFSNSVNNCTFFTYNDNLQYYTINPRHDNIEDIETCPIDYMKNPATMNLVLHDTPQLSYAPIYKELTYNNRTYTAEVNGNIIDFYKDYPCTDFSLYVKAPLDNHTLNSLESQIASELANKSTLEAVNFLLHFVQSSLKYKTDKQQFGYEKYFFAEETLASEYNDCEDRAILFTQLVRHFLHLPVALIYYRNIHLAAGVKFDKQYQQKDYYGEYMICDPTYIGADAGREMPLVYSKEDRILIPLD